MLAPAIILIAILYLINNFPSQLSAYSSAQFSLEDTIRLEDLGYFHLLSGYFHLLPAPCGRRMDLAPYRSART